MNPKDASVILLGAAALACVGLAAWDTFGSGSYTAQGLHYMEASGYKPGEILPAGAMLVRSGQVMEVTGPDVAPCPDVSPTEHCKSRVLRISPGMKAVTLRLLGQHDSDGRMAEVWQFVDTGQGHLLLEDAQGNLVTPVTAYQLHTLASKEPTTTAGGSSVRVTASAGRSAADIPSGQ